MYNIVKDPSSGSYLFQTENGLLTRIPMELDQENKESGLAASAHGCIITRKDFPHTEVLQKELIDKAANIIGQKIGLFQPG